MNLEKGEYQEQFDNIVAKACICNGLGTSALQVNQIDTKFEGTGVTICPGPNMAYFSEPVTLKSMVDHIYGRTNIIKRKDRPNVFIKELQLYISYLNSKAEHNKTAFDQKQAEFLDGFKKNLMDGIEYYKTMFSNLKEGFFESKANLLSDLAKLEKKLQKITLPETPGASS